MYLLVTFAKASITVTIITFFSKKYFIKQHVSLMYMIGFMNTAIQKYNYFKCFLKSHQGCIYLIKKYSENCNILKYYYNFKKAVFYMNVC